MNVSPVCPMCGRSNVRVSTHIATGIHANRGSKMGARLGLLGGVGAGLAATAATGGLFALVAVPAALGFGGNEVGKWVGHYIGKPGATGKLGYYCEDCKESWM